MSVSNILTIATRRVRVAGALAALAVIVPVRADAQAPRDSVTLDQAVELALRHSPAAAQSEAGVELAETAERTAWGSFLPSISINSGASLSSTERFNPQTNTTVTGSADSYSAGASASVDLFTGGRRTAELRRSKAATVSAEAALTEQRFAVVLATQRAFFEVLRAGELIGVAGARLSRAEEGLSAAERRAAVGSATRSDVLRSQLERNEAQRALIEARSSHNTAAFALGRLVGVSAPVAAIAAAAPEPRPLELSDEELEAAILAAAPVLEAAQAEARAADAGVRVARAQYLPSLRFSSGYDWFNQDPAFTGGRDSWSMRLSLSYPVFNGFQREETGARAEIQARIARLALEDARRGAIADLHRLLAALRLSEEQVTLNREAVAVAEEDLRVQQERYRLGASTILDRITSQANLAQAELDLVAARYDYQLALAALEALAGRTL